jgi:hypothetical protein
MGRGVVWANKFKCRSQKEDEFNAEVADLTGHLDLLVDDVSYLQAELNKGLNRCRMRVFGVWKQDGPKKRLELGIRPYRKRTK